ncbi:MAG: phosphocholine cytidylyltransferase family protein [bacterium]|nr:phosphocholine cytidylyltransferase family protein [bacterium]
MVEDNLRTAVVLAAGMGTRLQGLGGEKPKGFLQFGARPIIEESLLKLRDAGIERIIIVTGHESAHYEALARRYGGLVELVHNELYASSGSMYSLWLARDAVDGDFLLLESDLVYERRALEFLRAFPHRDAILVSGPTAAGDEVWIATRDGNLAGMSKERLELEDEVAGELVGISKVSRPLFQRMVAIAETAFRESLDVCYETDCMLQASRAHPIPCPVLADLVWGEVDDAEHLERVRGVVYPCTLAGDAVGDDPMADERRIPDDA